MTAVVGHIVLLFGGRRTPRGLRGLPFVAVTEPGLIDIATAEASRVIVVGDRADLAAVLTRLLRTERLDVEVAPLRRWFGVRRALTGTARRVPLIRDETGTVIAGSAHWAPADGAEAIEGEAVVDDAVLFDGTATGLRIEPLPTQPGLRATVLPSGRFGRRHWISGRAAQLGTPGATVIRDGIAVARPVRRSTFYRHTQGWLRVG